MKSPHFKFKACLQKSLADQSKHQLGMRGITTIILPLIIHRNDQKMFMFFGVWFMVIVFIYVQKWPVYKGPLMILTSLPLTVYCNFSIIFEQFMGCIRSQTSAIFAGDPPIDVHRCNHFLATNNLPTILYSILVHHVLQYSRKFQSHYYRGPQIDIHKCFALLYH